MKKFIKALEFLSKCRKEDYNYCNICAEHDMIIINDIELEKVSHEDVQELYKLGFIPGCDESGFDDIDFENITEDEWNELKDWVSDSFTFYC